MSRHLTSGRMWTPASGMQDRGAQSTVSATGLFPSRGTVRAGCSWHSPGWHSVRLATSMLAPRWGGDFRHDLRCGSWPRVLGQCFRSRFQSLCFFAQRGWVRGRLWWMWWMRWLDGTARLRPFLQYRIRSRSRRMRSGIDDEFLDRTVLLLLMRQSPTRGRGQSRVTSPRRQSVRSLLRLLFSAAVHLPWFPGSLEQLPPMGGCWNRHMRASVFRQGKTTGLLVSGAQHSPPGR